MCVGGGGGGGGGGGKGACVYIVIFKYFPCILAFFSSVFH